jgi:protein-L-isoaspartate(D-aspartate) O-methyltransferase
MVSYDPKDRYAGQREEMLSHDLKGRDITDPRVLEAMAGIPREVFIPLQYQNNAYEDNPLPIGMGQTISQPYIVALMTQCLKLTGGETVLEIGTGCGYQTAVLAGLCKKVYTIERFDALSAGAQTALSSLGIDNVEYFIGDGSRGWPDPKILFDRVLITAAVFEPPQPLLNQLKNGGLLVAPVGEQLYQTLTVYKKENDTLIQTEVCGCRFVKLVGQYGFKSD